MNCDKALKAGVLVLLFLLSFSAGASGRVSLLVGYENRMEPNTESTGRSSVGGLSALVSYMTRDLEFAFEACRQQTRTSEVGNLQVSNDRMELNAWLSYVFAASNWLSPFVGLGVGAFQEDINTQFAESSQDESGQWLAQPGLTAGANILMWNSWVVSGRVKALLPETQTKPSLAMGLTTGWRF